MTEKTITDNQTLWLMYKRMELVRAYRNFGCLVDEWDLPKYLAIIDNLQREIRRLKVKLAAKKT